MTEIRASQLAYGEEPDQYLELFESPSGHGTATVVLVHGGYWRRGLTAELMGPLVDYFLGKGMTVANVEYRRGPENAWPIPYEDVSTAVQTLRGHVSGPLCGIGHSVGGQLVLLSEKDFDSIVALAPVTDTARVYTEGLGDGAALEYFQCSPEDAPAVYASSSAVHQGTANTTALIVHGNNDDRVPLRHSLDYVAAQWASEAPVDTLFLASLEHLECIQPEHPAWTYITEWVQARSDKGAS